MNCSVGTCTAPAEVHEPLPLCGTDALRVIANYATANLPDPGSEPQVRQRPADDEIRTIYRLLDAEGWNAVNLNRAIDVLNRPKATAAKRLAEARKQYAAELGRRAGRSRREAEIDAIYTQLTRYGDPKAVTLEDVMEQYGHKQTTAWDRLEAARKLWAEANAA